MFALEWCTLALAATTCFLAGAAFGAETLTECSLMNFFSLSFLFSYSSIFSRFSAAASAPPKP